MNILIVSPDMMQKMLTLTELRDPVAGLNFSGSGMIGTPLGASVIMSSTVPAGMIIALDKSCALEMVTVGGITVDTEKLLNRQIERAAITAIAGFSKLFPEATKVLKMKCK